MIRNVAMANMPTIYLWRYHHPIIFTWYDLIQYPPKLSWGGRCSNALAAPTLFHVPAGFLRGTRALDYGQLGHQDGSCLHIWLGNMQVRPRRSHLKRYSLGNMDWPLRYHGIRLPLAYNRFFLATQRGNRQARVRI